jgi:methionyl aminopeptidase
MGVVRDFIGHGVGRQLHCEPKVYHYRNYRTIGRMAVGQTFTIEPQLTLGSPEVATWQDGWTVVTQDGSLSAQFEHVVLITENGYEILTLNPDRKPAA